MNDEVAQAEARLLELAAIGTALDPVPTEAFEAAVAAFAWRSIDAEMAELVGDTALNNQDLVGVRSRRTSQRLTFKAPHLVVELEVDNQAACPLVGQLVPAGAAEVEIRSPRSSIVVEADKRGRFWTHEHPGRVLMLRVRPRQRAIGWIATPWVSLISPSPH